MSWWDYGYQITAMANRTILVDNNTWNNTHISRVGQVSRWPSWCPAEVLVSWWNHLLCPRPWRPQRRGPMRSWGSWMSVMFWSSLEAWLDILLMVRTQTWDIWRFYFWKHPWNSLLSVITDINKFLWMVRIGGSTDTGRHIKEHDYYTPTGEFRVDREGSPVLLNCLMYKMCYYRFGQVYTEASEYLSSALPTVLTLIIITLFIYLVSTDLLQMYLWAFRATFELCVTLNKLCWVVSWRTLLYAWRRSSFNMMSPKLTLLLVALCCFLIRESLGSFCCWGPENATSSYWLGVNVHFQPLSWGSRWIIVLDEVWALIVCWLWNENWAEWWDWAAGLIWIDPNMDHSLNLLD